MIKTLNIGFIGQGFVGKNYANDFEAREYSVVRYSLKEPHINNKGKITGCDIVFIAVNANTKESKKDIDILEGVYGKE